MLRDFAVPEIQKCLILVHENVSSFLISTSQLVNNLDQFPYREGIKGQLKLEVQLDLASRQRST